MIQRRRLLSVAGISLAVIASWPALCGDAKPPRAVLELFTSQGCSSCPAADKLAAEIAREPDTIILSFAVDYWDYLGWKDTLANPAYTARQRAYAARRGDRQVYTPQMIVNGLEPVVGSDRGAIQQAVLQTRDKHPVLSVPVKVHEEDGQIVVSVGAGEGERGEVWLAALSDRRSVAVQRGENAQRTLTYVNVVRHMMRLGGWKGKEATFRVPRGEAVPSDANGYVVLVQAGSSGMPGPMLGAARMAP